jgi:phospho-N-acetylmuramoyl-pentapeptide-transferase
VNLTDGLDGLAAGACAMVFGAYTLITFIQFRNSCGTVSLPGCYLARDPIDLALVSASAMSACFGFLWWNASPAQIFMGDTGSMALGALWHGRTRHPVAHGAATGRSRRLVRRGDVVGHHPDGLVQDTRRRTGTGQRVFKMSPIHHHFELSGWQEITIIVRFWIIAGLAVAFGTGLFYAEFIGHG